MRWRRLLVPISAISLLLTLVAVQLMPASATAARPAHVLRYREAFEASIARQARVSAGAAAMAPSAVLDDFTIVGQADLGLSDTNGDVWVHGDHAYVGTWGEPCNGLGAKVVDVSDPANPVMIGRIAGVPGTSTEDIVVRSVSTPAFTGDLLAAGIQRCDFGDPALDDDKFGVDLWDVTDPANPVHFGHFGLTTGGGGAHEIDLFQRGQSVFVLAGTLFSEWFDPSHEGDIWIVDVTDPSAPAQVGEWGAGDEGLSPGPFYGIGSFGSMFGHSVRASEDGTKAFASYWDLGVVTLDITDVTDPAFVSRTLFPADADGDAHSMVPYSAGGRELLLTNDEDFDPRSPARVLVKGAPEGVANETPFARALFSLPNHRVTGRTVRPSRQGCSPADYGALRVEGRIAVVKTFLTFFDDPPAPEPACSERRQDRVAEQLGAAALVHDVVADGTSPQFFGGTNVRIPVLYTDHRTARDMVQAGRVRLIANTPSWGFLRAFDAVTGEQVASFADLPYVQKLHGPPGAWSIHNTEVNGDVAYSAWYSHGIVAVDLSPLAAATPGDPVLVGQFTPDEVSGGAAAFSGMWGVFVRTSDGLVFGSDGASGLWILQPTGDAVP